MSQQPRFPRAWWPQSGSLRDVWEEELWRPCHMSQCLHDCDTSTTPCIHCHYVRTQQEQTSGAPHPKGPRRGLTPPRTQDGSRVRELAPRRTELPTSYTRKPTLNPCSSACTDATPRGKQKHGRQAIVLEKAAAQHLRFSVSCLKQLSNNLTVIPSSAMSGGHGPSGPQECGEGGSQEGGAGGMEAVHSPRALLGS